MLSSVGPYCGGERCTAEVVVGDDIFVPSCRCCCWHIIRSAVMLALFSGGMAVSNRTEANLQATIGSVVFRQFRTNEAYCFPNMQFVRQLSVSSGVQMRISESALAVQSSDDPSGTLSHLSGHPADENELALDNRMLKWKGLASTLITEGHSD